MVFNKYQSSLEELDIYNCNQEIQDQFFDFINNVPFIKSLISPSRPKAKDLLKGNDGKIIVDVTQPHILEDMDYFRPTAIHYQKHGTLTNLRPNANPNSEFGKWIREEVRRCHEGYVRESDGEWITGDMYFFINYCPILLSKLVEGKKALRVWDFPEIWEGHYYKFHYIEQARNNGRHGAELASRSKGKSFSLASMIAKRFILGETKETTREVKCLVTAYQKEYLTKDGILSKFQSYIDFCSQNTQFPSKKLKSSLQDMQWKMGYLDLDTGTQKGTLNEVLGVSSKDDESKLRGKRGALIAIEEFGCHIEGTEVLMYDGSIKNVEDINLGDLLMGDDGTFREVKEKHSGEDMLYKITLSNGDYHIVNSKHLVYFKKYDWNKRTYTEHTLTPVELLNKDISKGYYIPKAILEFKKKEVPINPYFLGLWLGDGDSTRLDIANEDIEVLNWLQNNYDGYIRDLNQSKTCKIFHLSKKTHPYNKHYINYSLYNNKHIPKDYKLNSRDIQMSLVAGLVDSDGTYDKNKNFFEITQRYDRKHILEDVKFMCESNGLKCTLTKRVGNGKKPGVIHYRLRISGDLSIIPTKIFRKKGRLNNVYRSRNNWNYYTFKVEPYKVGKYYGFTVDSNHLFTLGDLTITHNSFPNLLGLYGTLRPSVEEGDVVYGLIYMQGTAGDDDSDFASAQEIMYNPLGYNMQDNPNVYDKEGQGRSRFVYFFPGYLNRKGCYDSNGNSDVTKALLEILKNRYTVKYNSTDVNAITKTISEVPITPQEAILRTKGNIFPVTALNERLNQIDNNPNFYSDTYIGTLEMSSNGKVEFRPTNDIPIREFPTKDNKVEGTVEIFEMPKEVQGKIPPERYIMSLDNYENDTANTMSLGSMFVLDLWTDRIVAEYTGRPMFSDDLNELARKMALFYNARILYENNKKNTFAYFSKMNCLYLLADTPEYLKQRQLVKSVGYGNTAKGVAATVPIKNYGFTLIRDWLLKPVTTIIKQDNEEIETTVPNLHFLKNRALIKELILFNPDINVDRIMSLVQLMLYREEKMVLYNGDITKAQNRTTSSYKGNDDYFTRNYDKKYKNSVNLGKGIPGYNL